MCCWLRQRSRASSAPLSSSSPHVAPPHVGDQGLRCTSPPGDPSSMWLGIRTSLGGLVAVLRSGDGDARAASRRRGASSRDPAASGDGSAVGSRRRPCRGRGGSDSGGDRGAERRVRGCRVGAGGGWRVTSSQGGHGHRPQDHDDAKGLLLEHWAAAEAYKFSPPDTNRSPVRNLGKPGYEAETRELRLMKGELDRKAERREVIFSEEGEE